MRNYELTIVLPGAITAAVKKDVLERIGKMLSANKGKIVKEEDWGKKQLAYSIAKNEEGVFIYFDIELPSEGVKNLSNQLKLEEQIIRHLLVIKEK